MLTALKPLTFPLLIFSSSEVEANSVVLVKGNGLISGNVGEMEMVGNGDENHGRRWRWLKQGQGRGYGEDGKTFQQKGWGGLDDFATICLQLSCSVLCGRTGGWWPPYFCWLQPFLSPPFLFLYLLPALFIPHWPHAAQLAGVAVCSQPQPSPSPPLLHIHITWWRKECGRSQPFESGEQRSISILCVLFGPWAQWWREGLSSDLEDKSKDRRVCVCVCMLGLGSRRLGSVTI